MAPKAERQPNTLEARLRREIDGFIERDGGLIIGNIPLGLIENKDVPVNQENLNIISGQLDEEAAAKGTDGQIQPIVLGLVKGHRRLDIIDGFHRFATFMARGHDHILGTVVPVTYEELLDKRIQNTRNHSGLQFARATEWVHESWSLHPLSHMMDTTTAFVLGRVRSSSGRRLGLDPDQVTSVMDWVDQKSSLWGLEPMTIYQYLHTSQHVDPRLVRNSRPDANQGTAPNSLPQSTLSRIGKQLRDRHDVQLRVAELISTEKLSGTGISSILSDIKGMTDDEAFSFMDTVDMKAYKERIASKLSLRYGEEDLVRLGHVRESSRVKPLDEISFLTIAQVELIIDEGGYDPGRLRIVSSDLMRIAGLLIEAAGKVNEALGQTAAAGIESPVRNHREVEEFSHALTQFLRDPKSDIDLQTDREATLAERAIARGRGTMQSLDLLTTKVAAYRTAQHA